MTIHGQNDPRIKKQEAEQISEVMRKNGLDYEYMLFLDEGHGLAGAENKEKFLGTIEKFLAKNLGGRCEELKVNR